MNEELAQLFGSELDITDPQYNTNSSRSHLAHSRGLEGPVKQEYQNEIRFEDGAIRDTGYAQQQQSRPSQSSYAPDRTSPASFYGYNRGYSPALKTESPLFPWTDSNYLESTGLTPKLIPVGMSPDGIKPYDTVRPKQMNRTTSQLDLNVSAPRALDEQQAQYVFRNLAGTQTLPSDDVTSYTPHSALTKSDITTEVFMKQPKKRSSASIQSNPLALIDVGESFPIVLDSTGNPIHYYFSSLLSGKFYSNDKFLSTSSADEFPIACYRRNYIELDTKLTFDYQPAFVVTSAESQTKQQHRLPINTIRITVEASSNFSDQPIQLSIFPNKRNAKAHETIMSSQVEEVPAARGTLDVALGRFQFKKATPNNGKSIVKDYYYITANIDAVSNRNAIRLASLKSTAISVRGRNPSFYNDRNDVLISTRSPVKDSIPHATKKSDQRRGSTTEDTTKKKSKAGIQITSVEVTPQKPTDDGRYSYFPIKSNYYLPPVRVYYFPHSAAHRRAELDALMRCGQTVCGPCSQEEPLAD